MKLSVIVTNTLNDNARLGPRPDTPPFGAPILNLSLLKFNIYPFHLEFSYGLGKRSGVFLKNHLFLRKNDFLEKYPRAASGFFTIFCHFW